jgi:hypothetical protein
LGSIAIQSGRWLVRFEEGMRGRFANYVPPVMEVLGLAIVEHNSKNNRMKGKIAS